MNKPTIDEMIEWLRRIPTDNPLMPVYIVSKLQELSTPDMFIPEDHYPDDCLGDLGHVFDLYCHVSIIELKCYRSFPNMFGVHVDGENLLFATEEEAEQFLDGCK